MIGTFGSKFISFLMLPFYTTWLSVNDYGLTDLMTVYSVLLVSILTLSLNEAIFVFPAGQSKMKQALYFSSGFWVILLLAFISTLIGVTLNIFSNIYKIQNTFLDNIYPILGLYFAYALQNYLQQFCRSINKMRTFCYSGIIYTGMTAVFSFLFIPKYGVLGFVWANILANTISSIFIFINDKIYEYLYWKAWNRIVFKQMINYSIPMIPNTIMWWILSAVNRPIIDRYLGLEAIGLFAVASKFPSILTSISGIFGSSWQVSVLQEYSNKDFPAFFNRVGTLYISILIVFSCLLSVFSPIIVETTTNEKFYSAWKYIPILTLAVVFSGIAGHTGTIFSATRKSKCFLFSSLAGAITSIVLNIILIPQFGLYGAAIGFTTSQIVIGAYRTYLANKIIKITIYPLSILLVVNLIVVFLIATDCRLLAYVSIAIAFLYFIFLNKYIIYKMAIKVIQPKLRKPF